MQPLNLSGLGGFFTGGDFFPPQHLPAGVGENPYAGSGKTQYLKLSNPPIK